MSRVYYTGAFLRRDMLRISRRWNAQSAFTRKNTNSARDEFGANSDILSSDESVAPIDERSINQQTRNTKSNQTIPH